MKDVILQKKPDEAVFRRLTAAANSLVARRDLQAGYPFDQETNLTGFYEWLLETGLCNTTLISVGSPYKEAWDMLHVDEFEREVIDFIAGTFGFHGNHWGVVTNGGTDGNLHGLYFGRKTLEAQSDRPPILYVSSEAHYSVQKLGDILRIETRIIGVHPSGRMDAEDLRRQLDPERPALVAIAVGGTFKGAIDDQREIDRVLREVNPPASYRHLDVALFGGYLPWLDDPAAREQVDQAVMGFDSLAVSGHKFFALNEPAGVFVCRKEILTHLNRLTVPYLGGIVMPTISCSRSGFDVLMPDYPLIPSHSCIEAIERIAEMAEGIDGLKCLSGSSAGGFIALHAAANLSHKPALMLIYPVVQPESSTGSMQRFRSTPMWDSRKNRWMWEHAMPEGHPSPPDLSGIGRAFIETAEYDPLRDEGRDLCGRLMEAGASAVLSETKGTFHGYDMLWRKPYVQQLIGRRITWLGTL